jgi:hypothetical protein
MLGYDPIRRSGGKVKGRENPVRPDFAFLGRMEANEDKTVQGLTTELEGTRKEPRMAQRVFCMILSLTVCSGLLVSPLAAQAAPV